MPTGAIFALLVLMPSLAFSEPGIWVKGDKFSQIHTRCLAKWECRPKEHILHGSDKVIVATTSKYVMGICNAGDGPTDSCNICASSPPKVPCEWNLAPK